MRRDVPELVIVTPVFNEAAGLAAYFDAVTRVFFNNPSIRARVVLVDDGSTDGSWAMIEAAARGANRITGVRLSRNFGAHVALAAGFDHVGPATDITAVLAADLQDPPETVLAFVDAWRAGADIVWGARRTRADTGWRRFASQAMESLLRRFAMPRGSKFCTGSFLLMDRIVLDCYLRYGEASRVTFALVAWTGFEQAVVTYDRQLRIAGKSGWSFGRMLNTAYDVFIGFSPVPAKLVTSLGFGLFLFSLAMIVYIITEWFVRAVQPGWTGVMVTVTFFFGVLFIMIGMLTEYLYRIFIETKGRPLYFVAAKANNPGANVPSDFNVSSAPHG
jgi:glycosyltransferase involved in cell wall biosynthesis